MTLDPETYASIAPVRALPQRGRAASSDLVAATSPGTRMLLAGPLVAVASMLAALVTTEAAGVPLRDPDHVAGRRLVGVLWLVGLLIVLDIVVRAALRSRGLRSVGRAIVSVRRERWTLERGVAVGSALVSFYVTYLAYRNLKSVVPLLRPGELFDRQLADLDRVMFGGHDPAALLHAVIGIGVQTHLMSDVYMIFFAFIPGTLASALVFSRNLKAGIFYVTAQSINWLLAAGSYFLLPSLGPVYADPATFAHLPDSGVTYLQDLLLSQRIEFLSDPVAGTAQSIAAFTSLHVSIFVTAALAAHLLGLARSVRIVAWILAALTTAATIYLGWHYVVDDLGGVAIAVTAIVLARALTGLDLRDARATSASRSAPG